MKTKPVVNLLLGLAIAFGLCHAALAQTPPSESNTKTLQVDIHGDIKSDRDRVTFWNDITIGKEESYNAIVVMLGSVEFYGETNDMVILGGSVHLYPGSKVNNELVVLGGKIVRDEGSYVAKDVVSIGSSFEPDIDVHIDVDEPFDRLERFWHRTTGFFGSLPFLIIWSFTVLAIVFGFGFLIIYVAPLLAKDSQSYLRQHLPHSFAWGVLFLLAIVPTAVLLALSIIGIPLIPLFVLFCLLLLFGGFVLAALQVGRLLPFAKAAGREGWALLTGLLLLWLIKCVPLFGKLLFLVVVVTGTGAVVKVLIDRLTDRRKTKQEITPTERTKKEEGEKS